MCLSLHLSAFQSAFLSVKMFSNPSIFPLACLSSYLFNVCLSICLPIFPSVSLSFHLSPCVSAYLEKFLYRILEWPGTLSKDAVHILIDFCSCCWMEKTKYMNKNNKMKPVDENCKFRAVVVAGILKPGRKTK